jgi:hypothetical protein
VSKDKPRLNVQAVLATGASALALAGAVEYFLLHLAYQRFYQHFGIGPSDVGLGRGEILVQAALGLFVYAAALALLVPVLLAFSAVLLALSVAYVGVIAVAVLAVADPLLRRSERGRRFSAARVRLTQRVRSRLNDIRTQRQTGIKRWRERRGSRSVRWLVASIVLLGVAYPSIFVVVASDKWGRLAARRGEVATGSRALGDLGTRIPVLAVAPVQVAGAVPVGQGDVPSVLGAASLRCTLFLGSANGFVLLFDVARQRLIRLPAGTAALEFEPGEAKDLPRDCRP